MLSNLDWIHTLKKDVAKKRVLNLFHWMFGLVFVLPTHKRKLLRGGKWKNMLDSTKLTALGEHVTTGFPTWKFLWFPFYFPPCILEQSFTLETPLLSCSLSARVFLSDDISFFSRRRRELGEWLSFFCLLSHTIQLELFQTNAERMENGK